MRIRYLVMIGIVVLVLVFSTLYFEEIGPLSKSSNLTFTIPTKTSATSENSQVSFDNTFTWNYSFPISVNYSGSWNLVYWRQNGTATQHNVTGNLSGSGNYETTVMLQGVGYVEMTLCAHATKLDSQNLKLTLSVLTFTNSTTAFNPSTKICATVAS